MEFKDSDALSCDILVIGGGGTGLRAAIEAREMNADVLVVSKSRVGQGNNTFISKAAIASTGWGDPQDGPEVHLKDTVIGGRFLNDQRLVAKVAQEAESEVSFLEKCGAQFAKKHDRIRVHYAAGHSYARHVQGEHRTGKDFVLPLKRYAQKVGVRFADRVFITKLFSSNKRIAAASGITKDGSFLVFGAKSVVLATGGYSQIYLHTNNAPGVSGDGHSLAFELGVPVKDMEFVQFYPTALGRLGRRILLYEALVINAGALLKNARGEDILAKHGIKDPKAMTRDRLARAIMHEITEGLDREGGVIMDLKPISEKRAAELAPLLPSGRSESEKEFILSPTTHFCMGGVVTGENTETSVSGLFAAGEVVAGVHGANRLAGNALCEVFTMGGIAGRNAALMAKEIEPPEIPRKDIGQEKARLASFVSRVGQDPKTLGRSLKEIMWQKAGIVRDRSSLEEALEGIQRLRSLAPGCSCQKGSALMRCLELQNMLVVSEMVCRAALLRKESRGSHYRSDYPEEDNAQWLKNIVIHKRGDGMELEAAPVSLDTICPEERRETI